MAAEKPAALRRRKLEQKAVLSTSELGLAGALRSGGEEDRVENLYKSSWAVPKSRTTLNEDGLSKKYPLFDTGHRFSTAVFSKQAPRLEKLFETVECKR